MAQTVRILKPSQASDLRCILSMHTPIVTGQMAGLITLMPMIEDTTTPKARRKRQIHVLSNVAASCYRRGKAGNAASCINHRPGKSSSDEISIREATSYLTY